VRTAVVACVVVALGASSARAGDDQVFVSFGFTGGVALHPELANGGVIGGEASAGIFGVEHGHGGGSEPAILSLSGSPYWFGGYADVVRDFGSDTTRFTIGPEVGRSYVGVDGGLLVDVGDTTHLGASGRVVATLSAVALYARAGFILDSGAPESHFIELGVLLKVPLPFHRLR
jgi:hypothetical protein